MANKSVGLLTIAFGADLRGFDRAMKNASKKITRFGNQMKNVGRNLTMSVTLPILGLAAASIKLASDTQESLNKVDVAFGDSGKKVKDFSNTTTQAFGISKSASLEMASLFGDLSTSIGFTQSSAADMSITLVSLAGELSSLKNAKIDIVQSALKGVFTGETEALKNLGIQTGEAILKESDYFLSLGKTWKQLTIQEKIVVRYAEVLKQTKIAQGDSARTAGDFAGQTRRLAAEVSDLGGEIGETLLPIALKIIEKVREWAKTFRGLSDEKKNLIVKIALIGAALGPVLIMLGSLTTIIVNGVVPAILLFSRSMIILGNTVAKNKILSIIAIVAALGYEMGVAAGLIKKFTMAGEDTSDMAEEGAKAIATVENEIANLEKTLGEGLNFDDLLGDSGGEKDLFGIDVEAEKKRAREVALAIKQEYLGLVEGKKLTQEEFNKQMESAELFHLDEMKSLYEKHGKDISDIDNQIHDNLIKNMEDKKTATLNLEGVLISAANEVANQLAQGADSFSELGDIAKSAIKEVIGGYIAMGVTAAITSAMSSTAMSGQFWLVPIVAKIASGLAKTAFNSLIPSFAEGGIVSAPMLAQVGDAPSGPEVIAPLDKLKSMLGSNQQQIEVVGRIAGDDIWLSNRKTGFNRFRSV